LVSELKASTHPAEEAKAGAKRRRKQAEPKKKPKAPETEIADADKTE